MNNINIFISYSHKDESFKNELLKYLKPIERDEEYEIISWTDREIPAGRILDDTISSQLLKSQIILLLVSQDFIASNYCYNIEMQKALELHENSKARVIPIILRDCTWDVTPLRELVALPQDGKPVKNWINKESAFLDISRGIKKSIYSFIKETKKIPGDDILAINQTIDDNKVFATNSSTKNESYYRNNNRHYYEKVYDQFSEFYDLWYEGHWQNDQPFKSILTLINTYYESARGSLSKLKILDLACGTGNTYIAFKRAGMNIYGSDGSLKMIKKAIENCKSRKISTDNLIQERVFWTDGEALTKHFGSCSFDVIVITANSFCHLPVLENYTTKALSNFYRLLKSEGLLIIDTKKYIQSGKINGLPIYKELKYSAADEEWIIRDERQECITLEDGREICFHTKMHYDFSPAFDKPVQRAFIVVSIYGNNHVPEIMVIPYYPIPAKILEEDMQRVGFKTKFFCGFKEPLNNWKYDIVVGQKK